VGHESHLLCLLFYLGQWYPLPPFPSYQGDPLSPFLFILMVEGLGRSLKVAVANQKIQRSNSSSLGGPLTHNQFLEDMMLMGTPSVL
jgi:hypothetical protein